MGESASGREEKKIERVNTLSDRGFPKRALQTPEVIKGKEKQFSGKKL